MNNSKDTFGVSAVQFLNTSGGVYCKGGDNFRFAPSEDSTVWEIEDRFIKILQTVINNQDIPDSRKDAKSDRIIKIVGAEDCAKVLNALGIGKNPTVQFDSDPQKLAIQSYIKARLHKPEYDDPFKLGISRTIKLAAALLTLAGHSKDTLEPKIRKAIEHGDLDPAIKTTRQQTTNLRVR